MGGKRKKVQQGKNVCTHRLFQRSRAENRTKKKKITNVPSVLRKI